MRRTLLIAGFFVLAATGAAEARGHGFGTFHAPKAARAPKAPKSEAAAPRRHRHPREAKVEDLGPQTFHPVKPYKGFSYLEHEKHPDKD